MLNNIISFWKKHSTKLYKRLYLLSAIIFAIYHIIQGIFVTMDYSSGKYVQQSVYLHRFELVDCEIIDDLTFASTGTETRMIYNGEIDTIYIDCLHSYGLREFVAYYNTTGDYSFPRENELRPKQFGKYLVYDFPRDTVQVKMPYPNARMYFNELVLNCREHTNKFNFTTTNLVTLAIVPTMVFLAVDILISILGKIARLFK